MVKNFQGQLLPNDKGQGRSLRALPGPAYVRFDLSLNSSF